MQRTFIILPEFDKNWKSMGLSDEDLRHLENLILQDPEAGALMQGTGGLRKLALLSKIVEKAEVRGSATLISSFGKRSF